MRNSEHDRARTDAASARFGGLLNFLDFLLTYRRLLLPILNCVAKSLEKGNEIQNKFSTDFTDVNTQSFSQVSMLG